MGAVEATVRGGCALGKATVRPSGFWPYCTGWNNLDVVWAGAEHHETQRPGCGASDTAAADTAARGRVKEGRDF